MATVWEKVTRLEGKKLFTLYRQKPFSIVSVSSTVVKFIPLEGKQRRRGIRRERIEHLASLGLSKDDLRKRIQEIYPESQNTSYYAAIVHEISRG
jgi:hypothetical protein